MGIYSFLVPLIIFNIMICILLINWLSLSDLISGSIAGVLGAILYKLLYG